MQALSEWPFPQIAQKKVYSHQTGEYYPRRGVKDMKGIFQQYIRTELTVLKCCLLIMLASGLAGCRSLSLEERAGLDAKAEENILKMTARNPELEEKLETCAGYLAMDARLVKIPFIGWGGGKGVVVNNGTGQRTYVKASRMDVGGGGGIREFDVLIVLYDEKKMGIWPGSGSLGRHGQRGGFQQPASNG